MTIRNFFKAGWIVILLLCGLLMLTGCNKKEETSTQSEPSAKIEPPAQNEPPAPSNLQQSQGGETAQSSHGQAAKTAGGGQRSMPSGKEAVKTGGAAQRNLPMGKEIAKMETPPLPPRQFTLPAGSEIIVLTTAPLSSKTNKTGDAFEATLSDAIADGGWVIAEKNAMVKGVVSKSDFGGKMKGVASLTVALTGIELADGRSIQVATEPVVVQAGSSLKKDAVKVGIGAGIGAAIGAIAGGGKGAAIGAGVGGGAGTATVLATAGDPAKIPSESRLTFKLAQPLTVKQIKK